MIAGLSFCGISAFGAHISPLLLHLQCLWAAPKAGWGHRSVRSFKSCNWQLNTWGRVGILDNFPGTYSEEPFLGLVYTKSCLDTTFLLGKILGCFFLPLVILGQDLM